MSEGVLAAWNSAVKVLDWLFKDLATIKNFSDFPVVVVLRLRILEKL